jgi:hypothetical protein
MNGLQGQSANKVSTRQGCGWNKETTNVVHLGLVLWHVDGTILDEVAATSLKKSLGKTPGDEAK